MTGCFALHACVPGWLLNNCVCVCVCREEERHQAVSLQISSARSNLVYVDCNDTEHKPQHFDKVGTPGRAAHTKHAILSCRECGLCFPEHGGEQFDFIRSVAQIKAAALVETVQFILWRCQGSRAEPLIMPL